MSFCETTDKLKVIRESTGFTELATIKTRIKKVTGLMIEADALRVPIGSRLVVHSSRTDHKTPVECVGFSSDGILLMPYGVMEGISPGDEVIFESATQDIRVSDDLLGHVLDGEGKVIDGSDIHLDKSVPLYRESPAALSRKNSKEMFETGIRSWDSFLTMGLGQRMGIFAGTGVGKSVLLGMIAKRSNADINVLALVGERGGEVKEFIEDVLGEEGMKKSVIVVATSDQSPLMRIRAAFVAKSIAEHFASQGKNVLYLLDSVTRMAMALRELGLSIGEPPTAKGYPPSVFSTLPRLLERAGNFEHGSITSIISVLLEGDDLQDPIGDAVRGILDGHVVLDRELANRGHYPAISVNDSISRWMNAIVDEDHINLSIKAREMISEYKNAEDLINVGAYVSGSNPTVDQSIAVRPSLNKFLTQKVAESSIHEENLVTLKAMFAG